MDPRYVMKHKLSATWVLSYFLLEPEAISKKHLQSYKTEIQKNEKYAARNITFTALETEDENGEVTPYDPPAPHNTESEAINHVIQDEIRGKPRRLDAMNRKWSEVRKNPKFF